MEGVVMLLFRVLVVFAGVTSMGCAAVVRPTKPSTVSAALADSPTTVRFASDAISIREPGLPLSPSRAWLREVQNYTAEGLNTMVSAPDAAPVAQTTVTFDLASPSVLQIGTWKEMTISMQSTLPNGQVVKSEAVSANIDDPLEYAAVTGLGIGGTVLDVGAAIVSIFWIFQSSPQNQLLVGGVFIGALLGGVALNLGQQGAQYLVAGREETRWSDMYQRAMKQHAMDIRNRALLPAPPPTPATPSIGPTMPMTPPATQIPPVLDPSDGPPQPLSPAATPPAQPSPTTTP
jgi:hypothetical protein